MTAKDCGLAALTIPSCAFATASSMSLANEGILTDMRINDAIRDSRLASNAVLLPDPRTGCLYDDLVAAGMKAGKIEDADVAGLHDSSDTGLSVGSSDFCAPPQELLGGPGRFEPGERWRVHDSYQQERPALRRH